MPRQHIEHQSTADMGRPPGGTPAQFFCTVSAACAVCLPVLCVCDVCVCAGYVSQHTALVLTSHHLVPTLQHLVLSRTISHQSPQHLVPISHTDLAASNLARSHVQTFHHLDRSRGTISHRSCSTILHRPRSTISCILYRSRSISHWPRGIISCRSRSTHRSRSTISCRSHSTISYHHLVLSSQYCCVAMGCAWCLLAPTPMDFLAPCAIT